MSKKARGTLNNLFVDPSPPVSQAAVTATETGPESTETPERAQPVPQDTKAAPEAPGADTVDIDGDVETDGQEPARPVRQAKVSPARQKRTQLGSPVAVPPPPRVTTAADEEKRRRKLAQANRQLRMDAGKLAAARRAVTTAEQMFGLTVVEADEAGLPHEVMLGIAYESGLERVDVDMHLPD